MYTIDKAKSQANMMVTISFEVYFSLGLSIIFKAFERAYSNAMPQIVSEVVIN